MDRSTDGYQADCACPFLASAATMSASAAFTRGWFFRAMSVTSSRVHTTAGAGGPAVITGG